MSLRDKAHLQSASRRKAHRHLQSASSSAFAALPKFQVEQVDIHAQSKDLHLLGTSERSVLLSDVRSLERCSSIMITA